MSANRYIGLAIRMLPVVMVVATPSVASAAIFLTGKIVFENVNGPLTFVLDPRIDPPENQVPKVPGTYTIYLGNGLFAQVTIGMTAGGLDITSWKMTGVTDGLKVHSVSRDEYDTDLKVELPLGVFDFDPLKFRLDHSDPVEPVFYALDPATAGLTDFAFVTRPVPEPATWAMMLAGLGLAAASLRRRRTIVAFA